MESNVTLYTFKFCADPAHTAPTLLSSCSIHQITLSVITDFLGNHRCSFGSHPPWTQVFWSRQYSKNNSSCKFYKGISPSIRRNKSHESTIAAFRQNLMCGQYHVLLLNFIRCAARSLSLRSTPPMYLLYS